MTTGEMLSITSAGMPRMPLGKAVAERPSLKLLHHLQQARPADLVAAGLGVEVVGDLEGRAHVGPHNAQHLLVGFATSEEARDRHEEPLLVDLPPRLCRLGLHPCRVR
jgi:hypothetical protein